MIVLGILSSLTLLADVRKISISKILYIFIFIFSIALAVFSQQIGTTGGEVRHTEIRSSNTQITNPEGNLQQKQNQQIEQAGDD